MKFVADHGEGTGLHDGYEAQSGASWPFIWSLANMRPTTRLPKLSRPTTEYVYLAGGAKSTNIWAIPDCTCFEH
jgi:hypothetical protein